MPPVEPTRKSRRQADMPTSPPDVAPGVDHHRELRAVAVRLGRFCILALVIYAALLAPWPGVRPAYRAVHNAAANALFGNWSQTARVEFAPLNDRARTKEKDTLVTIQVRGVATRGNVEISSIRNGFLPTAELVALILATPIALRRRLWALFWGLILVNGFVAVRLAAMLVYYFCYPWEVRLYDPGPLMAKVIVESHELLFRAPTCTFIVPVLIWIVIAVRDRNKLVCCD